MGLFDFMVTLTVTAFPKYQRGRDYQTPLLNDNGGQF